MKTRLLCMCPRVVPAKDSSLGPGSVGLLTGCRLITCSAPCPLPRTAPCLAHAPGLGHTPFLCFFCAPLTQCLLKRADPNFIPHLTRIVPVFCGDLGTHLKKKKRFKQLKRSLIQDLAAQLKGIEGTRAAWLWQALSFPAFPLPC